MSHAFENARLPLRRIYSLVDETPDIFEEDLEKEVRNFIKEQLPPDQEEVMVSSLSDGLLSLDGVEDVFRNLAVDDGLNDDAELNDGALKTMAKVALQLLPAANLKSKRSFSLLPLAKYTCQFLKLTKGNSGWVCGVARLEPRRKIEDNVMWWKALVKLSGPEFQRPRSSRRRKYVKRSLANTVTDMEELMRRLHDPHCVKPPFIVRASGATDEVLSSFYQHVLKGKIIRIQGFIN